MSKWFRGHYGSDQGLHKGPMRKNADWKGAQGDPPRTLNPKNFNKPSRVLNPEKTLRPLTLNPKP